MSIFSFLGNLIFKPQQAPPKQARHQRPQRDTGLRLWLGKATGKLVKTGHVASIKQGEQVILSQGDILQSIAIIGDPGTGKTSGAIRPFVLQLLDQEAGLVILDGKNDLGPEVVQLAQQLQRRVYRIGVGGLPFNLFDGLTPEQISAILKQAFELTGAGGGRNSGFFTTQAVMRCKHALGLLATMPEHYNIVGLRKYVFDETFLASVVKNSAEKLDGMETLIKEYKEKLQALEETKAESGEKQELKKRLQGLEDRRQELAEHFDYEVITWPQIAKAQETVGGIIATLQNVIDRFSAPELARAFCSTSENQAKLSELESGAIFVVDIPFDEYDFAAQVVLIFLKETVFRLIKARSRLPEAQKRSVRPIGIIADEYQKITGGTSDLGSIDTCRSLGGFMIVGFQSLNSLYSAIPNTATVKAILGNLVQKIVFATGDPDTIEWAQKLFGEAEVYRESENFGVSSGHQGLGRNEGTNRQLVKLPIVTAQTFQDLRQNERITQGLVMLRIGGTTHGDILDFEKIYASDILTPQETSA
jgi:Type IV secretory system Conjugative DNA transfer